MTTIYWSNEDICQSTSKRVRFCLWLNKYICISIFPGFLCKWSTTNGTTYDLYTGLADGRQFPRLYSLNKTFLTFRLAIIKKRYLVSCYHNTLQYVYISADIYVFKISYTDRFFGMMNTHTCHIINNVQNGIQIKGIQRTNIHLWLYTQTPSNQSIHVFHLKYPHDPWRTNIKAMDKIMGLSRH